MPCRTERVLGCIHTFTDSNKRSLSFDIFTVLRFKRILDIIFNFFPYALKLPTIKKHRGIQSRQGWARTAFVAFNVRTTRTHTITLYKLDNDQLPFLLAINIDLLCSSSAPCTAAPHLLFYKIISSHVLLCGSVCVYFCPQACVRACRCETYRCVFHFFFFRE